MVPVRRKSGEAAILKIATHKEEIAGNGLMRWWNGDGAARVYAHENAALLLERAAEPTRSLTSFTMAGRDEEGLRAACHVAARLHAPRRTPPPPLVPLTRWFASLHPLAQAHGGILAEASVTAQALLKSPQTPTVLHGDIHQDNVLYFGERRNWLAIDPKGLIGERAFDFANLFLNPGEHIPVDPKRFERRLGIVAEAARLDRTRLTQWVLAWSGLSAAFSLEDGDKPGVALAVARLSSAALKR